MSHDLPEPERWCNLPDRGQTAEEALGATFRRVREATEPPDAAVARVSRRINAATRSPRGQLMGRVALAAVLIMATGGAVGAALNRWRHAVAAAPQAPASVDSPMRSSEAHRRKHRARMPRAIDSLGAVDPVDPSDPGDLIAPVGVTDPLAASDPRVASEPTPPVAVAPSLAPPASAALVAPSSSVPSVSSSSPSLRGAPSAANAARGSQRHATGSASTEARLLAGVFLQLRSGGDAAAALQSLDQYDRRFPTGALHDEARIARVEALLTLDRRAEALRLLESIGGGAGALTRDVQITRGELLVERGRCANALRDLDAILAAREDDAAGARALYSRASCQLRAGDVAAARRDLARYLSLNPNGPSAAAARRALNGLP